MSLTLLDITAFADVPYEISRFVLRFASVMFLAYVLTVVISLILTWRPKRKETAGAVRKGEPVRVVTEAKTPAPVASAISSKEAFESRLHKMECDAIASDAAPETKPMRKLDVELSTAEVQK